MLGLFVTGTDTGVGKTRVSEALARAVRSRGASVAALKPVESGCQERDRTLLALDAERLRRASDMAVSNILYRYKAAVAPGVAARLEGPPPDIAKIATWVGGFDCQRLLVEGAGGWLVPLVGDLFMRDLARELSLPVLVVCRPSLGTINHSLLTMANVKDAGCQLAGFVVSESVATEAETLQSNVEEIERGAEVLGFPTRCWGVLAYRPRATAGGDRLELREPIDPWLDCST